VSVLVVTTEHECIAVEPLHDAAVDAEAQSALEPQRSSALQSPVTTTLRATINQHLLDWSVEESFMATELHLTHGYSQGHRVGQGRLWQYR
jgi:hypothetical protein